MIAVHAVFVVFFGWVIVLSANSGNVAFSSISDIRDAKSQNYTDTKAFADQINMDGLNVLNNIDVKRNVETDGKYDAKKIVDVEAYVKDGTITGKNTSGIAYKLGDLEAWSGEGNGYNYMDSEEVVVVCQKPDDTYHYYTFAEFRKLVADQTLNLVDDLNERETSEIMYDLQNSYMINESGSDVLVKNKDGETVYTSFWSMDEAINERYKTEDGKTLLDIANENAEWNGKLSQMYDYVNEALLTLIRDKESYTDIESKYSEGNTNLAYILVDRTNKKVYTNRKAYTDYAQADASIEDLKKLGAYVVTANNLDAFQTNVQTTAGDWKRVSHYKVAKDVDYTYAVAVNTKLPIQDSYYEEADNYENYGKYVMPLIVALVITGILFLIGAVWLIVTAGRTNRDDELHLYRFDRIWTELGILIGLCTWIPGYLSIVRRIKAGNLWEYSILRKFCRLIGRMLRSLRAFWRNRRSVWKIALASAGVFLVNMIAFTNRPSSGMWLLITIIVDGAAMIWLLREAMAKEKVRRGIQEIAEGNVSYQIPLDGLSGDSLRQAELVNNIGGGLQRAVDESMKSERMKTDLITNVSHDIKTPLTSIINYVDLLKRENIQDPKIQGYIQVLETKAARLKQLTEDVVEASKLSSGNITLEYMNLNLVELINQVEGEFAEKFADKNLTLVKHLPEEPVIVRVDGRRLSRVLDNIYGNAAKYAMPGTRIYADLSVDGKKASFALKNISEEPLNISADELTERFIRGDVSRSTEGSGLGLSIAQSLTELMGGEFNLYLDGDLFRVTVTLGLDF